MLDDYAARFHARKPVLMHSDLHHENILYNPDTQKMTAVLDWGNAAFSLTPEIEFLRFCNNTDHAAALYDTAFAVAAFAGYCAETNGIYKPSDLAAYQLIEKIGACMATSSGINFFAGLFDVAVKDLCDEFDLILDPSLHRVLRSCNAPKQKP